MKNLRFALLCAICLLALLISERAFAQRYVMMDYMYVPEEQQANYLEVEQELWKPIHKEFLKDGNLQGWYLLEIPYPGGTNAEYHYITVRVYKEPVANPMDGLMDKARKVHPDADLEAFADKTMQSRDLVKTHGFYAWEAFGWEDRKMSTVGQQVYFRVPMDKWEAYRKMEVEDYHPMHKAEIAAGYRHGWMGLQLMRPMGMAEPYQFVAVDFYKDYDQYIRRMPADERAAAFKKALPNRTEESISQNFYDTVELVHLEEWRLVDYVRAEN